MNYDEKVKMPDGYYYVEAKFNDQPTTNSWRLIKVHLPGSKFPPNSVPWRIIDKIMKDYSLNNLSTIEAGFYDEAIERIMNEERMAVVEEIFK